MTLQIDERPTHLAASPIAAMPNGNDDAAPQASARDLAKTWAKRLVVGTGCGLNSVFGSLATGRFGILMYHRVADRVKGVPDPTCNVTPAAFRAQMIGLLERGYQAWPLRRLIAEAQNLPPDARIFVVTFDDGYQCIYDYAWPTLKELGIPATLFLATAYLDSEEPLPFDAWSAAGSDRVPTHSWRPLTLAQCLAMAADGLVELAAHTHTHQDFCGRPGDFEKDLAVNIDLLQSWLGIENPAMAFPYGRATTHMMRTARRAGCTCALTTYGVPVDPCTSPFGWGRFHVESWDTGATLSARLNGWQTWVPRLRRMLAGGHSWEIIA